MVHNEFGEIKHALAGIISAKFRNRENSTTHFSTQNIERTIEQENTTIEQAIEALTEELSETDTVHRSCIHILPELEDILAGIIESNIEILDTTNTSLPLHAKDIETIDFHDDCENTKKIFGCALCTRLYYEPICTPCGHTFCSECLERCYDHRAVCPMCQSSIKDIYQYQKCTISIDWSLHSIMKNYLPILFKGREYCEEKAADLHRTNIPLFVCIVVFPFTTIKIHIFEPRYLLMLRRVIKFNEGKFGMVGHCPTHEYRKIGTILQITDTTYLACGKSIVTCIGIRRFQVLEHEKCDGYFTATKIKYISDEEKSNSKVENETKIVANDVYKRAKEWFEMKPQNFKQMIEVQCGKFPEQDNEKGENGPKWMWWVHSVLPEDDKTKLFVLRHTKVRARLSIINYILKRIESANSSIETHPIT